jgi:hypothetical protein
MRNMFRAALVAAGLALAIAPAAYGEGGGLPGTEVPPVPMSAANS